jgi:hypothetical protein
MVLAAALILTACGGSSSSGSSAPATSTSDSTSVTSSTAARAHPPHRRARTAVPHGAKPVASAQRVHAGGSLLSVTVSRIYASLTATGSPPPPGTRAAGVALTIANLSGATYDSTASGDVSVVLSAGSAAPLYIKAGVCQTPLTDFESLISAGETRSGCVGFAVPHRARIVAVRFSPHSRTPGTVSWAAGSGG